MRPGAGATRSTTTGANNARPRRSRYHAREEQTQHQVGPECQDVLGTRLSSSARVIRISILVQGGACGAAPGRCCCSRKPLARGMRPPAGPRAARGCTGAGDRHTRGQSQPTNKGMPSPGGQVSEMVGHGVCPPSRGRGRRVRAISSTSQRAITPAPGGKPGQARAGIVRMLPPGAGVIGLRQVDEMALRLPQWRAERTAHPRPPLTVCVSTASQPRRIAALSPEDVNGRPARIDLRIRTRQVAPGIASRRRSPIMPGEYPMLLNRTVEDSSADHGAFAAWRRASVSSRSRRA